MRGFFTYTLFAHSLPVDLRADQDNTGDISWL